MFHDDDDKSTIASQAFLKETMCVFNRLGIFYNYQTREILCRFEALKSPERNSIFEIKLPLMLVAQCGEGESSVSKLCWERK